MVQEQSSSHHHQQQHPHHHPLPKYGNGVGGAGAAATGVARASKKSKPKKVPQRGLGVAQLEKLRIEEQKKMDGGATVVSSGTAMAAPPPHSRALGHFLPLHPPLPPLPPLRPAAADGGGGFTPVLWDPADPMKHPYRPRSLCPPPPLPMVSTGLSLTASPSHPPEPPSNQMYSSSSSFRTNAAAPAEDDREAAGVDRSWPFMFEGMTAASFRPGKAAPAMPPPFAPRTATADVCPDLTRYEFRATNYFSANMKYSDWAPEFGLCKSSSRANSCAGEPGFLTLSAQAPQHLMKQQPHAIPSIHHLPEYSDFGAMPPSQHGSVSSASASPRPFYSFLPACPVRRERPLLGECRADVADGGVDLELKLWKS